jgi:hypothetical protein
LHSSIVLLTPVMHPASIKILCDSVKGIRSVSSVTIKVVAPLTRSMQLWRGVGVDSFAGVEFINAELRGGSQSATLISSAHLLAMVQRAHADSHGGAAGNLYVFVGVEAYAEAFAECAFALRRWFGPASVFALDMRRENPQASPVDSEWSTRRSLASRATLLTFDSRFDAGAVGAAAVKVKVLPDPRRGEVPLAVRQRARARMNVSDNDFALAVVSDEVSSTGIARQAALIRALMQAPSSRLLIAGVGHEPAAWLADLSATFPGRVRIMGACANGTCDFDAADVLLMPAGALGASRSLPCATDARDVDEMSAEPGHQMIVLEDDMGTHEVDDFIQAVGLLPPRASREVEILRSEFLRTLQAKMSVRFGRSLYYAVRQLI